MTTSTVATARVAQPKTRTINLSQILESVALALEAYGEKQLIGMQGIEDREIKDIISSQVEFNPVELAMTYCDQKRFNNMKIDGTIFGAIADELTLLGFKEPKTIGEVAVALGIDLADEEVARDSIHKLGCWCLGTTISAQTAAQRIRDLKT